MDKKYGILIISVAILFLCFVGTASAKTWYVDSDLQDFPYADFTNTLQGKSSNNATYSNNTMIVFPFGTTINSEEHEFVLGELIVKFKPRVCVNSQISTKGIVTTGYRSIDTLNEQHGVISLGKVFKPAKKPVAKEIPDFINIYILKLPIDADIPSIAGAYKKNPNVEYAEPNYIAHICVKPNDPYYSQQWAHQNMQSEQAWDIEKGDSSVVIAIIDTGVDWDHPDLAANIWNNTDEILDGNDTDGNGYVDDIRGWDSVDTTSPVYPGEDGTVRDNDPMDFHGHGTHCSGIAGAVTNNGMGIAGMCWNCKIMAVRSGYKGADGNGYLESDDTAAAIVYAADNGADVISMSWGDYTDSSLIKDTIDYAYFKGVVLVGAAGNDDTKTRVYPASYDNVIAVSATNSSDTKARFSNYGSWVDVAAPGININSTVFDDIYVSWSGTSMSTPFVAGLAGLILSKNSTFSNEEVRNILRSTADPVISTEYIGLGRINAYNAILRDSTLIANLDSSLDDAIVQDVISINGTASGNNFHKYELYYGLGVYPTNWTQIGSTQYTQVVDGVLDTWNTSLIIDGTYSIRLDAIDVNGQVTEDRVVIKIDNTLQDGWPIYLDTFAILASPVTFDFNNDGKNEIVIATYGPPGNSYGSGRIYVINSNGTIASGWPFITNYCAPATPAVGDLNNDGIPEIVATSWNYIYVLHFDGSLVWQKGESEVSCATPVLADMDGNGDLEIILTADAGKIFAWNYNGSDVDGWPITINASYDWCLSTPAVGDIDNDGHIEIVVNTENNETYVLNHDGSVTDGWPKNIPSVSWWAVNIPPALADLNGDGDLEIIIDAVDKLYVLNQDGSILNGWPKNIERYGNNAFSLSDLDSDGLPEIVFGRSGSEGYLYALNGDGSNVTGWPITGFMVGTPCAIADIDSDLAPEVIVRGGGDDKIYIFNNDGSSVYGWPKIIEDFGHSGTISPSPLVTDLDGDGDIEIVALSFFNSVYVWDLSGTYDPSTMEWPMFQHDTWHTGLYGFVVADTTSPVITNISAMNITTNSATIAWDTNEPSDSLVKYGTESGNYTLIAYNGSNVTLHIVDLTGLTANTTYYYIVNSTDQNGNSNQSKEYSFTTKIIISEIFDTEAPANPYPSIFGTHNGTITPNQTITVSKLYTYSCEGTGGHTNYARIWNNFCLDVNASWEGYVGDWHSIFFSEPFTLVANETYNYTIKTGSYPQIHHIPTLPTTNGWINCTEFTDVNGKRYKDWIPAIRLE